MKSVVDTVVVGAGSAGCVAANRLSADPSRSVLLIEAGTDAPPTSQLRSLDFFAAARNPSRSWPDLHARRSRSQPPRKLLQGRGVGGTSVINGLIAMRPMPEDFDQWADAGAPGWSYRDVLPSLIRLETDLDFGTRPEHGDSGPVPMRRIPKQRWGPLDRVLSEWAEQEGVRYAEDHNRAGTTGVSPYSFSAWSQSRVSAADAFLTPALDRPNLTLSPLTDVERVMVRSGRVAGVECVRDGSQWTVHADEVVLAAGAIGSPALLLRSGIGPAGHLERTGIEVAADVPGVGAGLQDHAALTLAVRTPGQQPPPERSTNCCVRFDAGLAGSEPNELMLNALNEVDPGVGAIVLSLFRPRSRGRVELAGPTRSDGLVVDLGLLDSAQDRELMRAGVARLAELAESPSLAEIGVPLGAGGLRRRLAAPGELDAWLSTRCHEAWHLVGSCRMGDTSSPGTVVDPNCRVSGVRGLRVVDASVVPRVPRANTNLVAMMVAEHTLYEEEVASR